jgi:putative membrane protein
MPDLLLSAYPWLKALHIISVVLWLGAQMLLPSLLAAQRGLPLAAPESVLLLRVARQLTMHLMNPAMLAAFVFGALLASVHVAGAEQFPGWLGFKLGLVFVLSGLHGKLYQQLRYARTGRSQWSAAGYRWVQGVDALLLAGIVGLVVLKPSLSLNY